MEFTVTPESLAMIAGVILSLLFSYIPGFRAWFDQFEPEAKRLFMLLLLVLSTAGAFVLACAGVLGGIVCAPPDLYRVIGALIMAVIANQSIYSISPKVG